MAQSHRDENRPESERNFPEKGPNIVLYMALPGAPGTFPRYGAFKQKALKT
jgi:hypothetical protein